MIDRPMDVLITGALLLDPADGVARAASLGIRGQRIVHVGLSGEATPAAVRHLHLPGRVVVPGFVNTHYHAGLNFVRGVAPDCGFAPSYTPGLPQASWLSPEEALALSRLGALEALRAGCTTLVDSFVHAEHTVAGMAETGVRLFASQRLADVDFASVLRGTRRFDLERGLAAHAPDTCSVDLLRHIDAVARRHGLQISTHLAQSQDELDWVRATYDRSPVQLLDELGMLDSRLLAGHCIHVDDDDIARIGASGAHVVHIPVGNAMSGRVAPTRRLLHAGARLCLATDTMHGDMVEVMRWALAVGRLSAGRVADDWQPLDVLRMATVNGAAAIGWGEQLGRLAVGHLADLAILDYRQLHLTPCIDPLGSLVHNATGADVETVIVNGQVVIEQGRSTLVDEARVRAEADRACRALWQRCETPLRAYPSPNSLTGASA
jgi:5-methylthioadenosine/S-adenosylhomocysteine deaminase